ncbi:LysR family transcriptional regulator [Clostridium sp. WILCCON 0269]|uniref:LysR family transcriptional regulator n=1 Tax=Candidatus Clostridium eludens TaxID=3381663 RepID=A0ABW8SKL3_9CLOT
MLFKQIYYFVKVVDCNSFTEAAEECFISQSAISQQIQALEADLGVELIVRENRKFSLTPAGEHFYRHSLLLLDEVDRLKQETHHIARNRDNIVSIGYCKSYGLQELQQAIAVFSEKYSNIDIQIINGNHEELYQYLKNGYVSLVINDQRRALSDEYVNYHLCTAYSYVEVAGRSTLSNFEAIAIEELKRVPCILVASKEQQENEREYYKNTLGFAGNFLFVENLEEGRLLVAGNKGFLPVEGSNRLMQAGIAIKRLPLFRSGNQIQRNYFAFWKKDKDLDLIREFADILRTIFQRSKME